MRVYVCGGGSGEEERFFLIIPIVLKAIKRK